jgi:hypothetical protein
MPYLPRHKSHRKKKSILPYILILLILASLGIGYTQERQIRLFFAKDQRQKLEKQKAKIKISLEKNELTEIHTRDFETYANDFLEKEPLDPSANHFKARSYFYELLLTGVRFDSSSLVAQINEPISRIFGESKQSFSDLSLIYEYAKKADAIRSNFTEMESNNFLLFLGELTRERKKPTLLYKEYSSIDVKLLDPEFQHPHVWLLFYTAVRTGKQKELEKLMEMNREQNFPGKLLLTEREETFLKGVCHYHAKDYVPALNSLRKVKLEVPDSISRNATLVEARIFYIQNLPQKAVDLLTTAYVSGGKVHKEFKLQVLEWTKLRPDLKTSIIKEEPILQEEEEPDNE